VSCEYAQSMQGGYSECLKDDTVNQLLFAAVLFRDSSVINWIAATNFRDRSVFIDNVLYVMFGL
jgi:hypothetical protein